MLQNLKEYLKFFFRFCSSIGEKGNGEKKGDEKSLETKKRENWIKKEKKRKNAERIQNECRTNVDECRTNAERVQNECRTVKECKEKEMKKSNNKIVRQNKQTIVS